MDSCFPPLASLSLRGNSKSASKSNKNRHSTDGSSHHSPSFFYRPSDYSARNKTEMMPKLEVLQDLDLYYIRQIAQSFKVSNVWCFFFVCADSWEIFVVVVRTYFCFCFGLCLLWFFIFIYDRSYFHHFFPLSLCVISYILQWETKYSRLYPSKYLFIA